MESRRSDIISPCAIKFVLRKKTEKVNGAMGWEVSDMNGKVVAEVFRCDANHTVTFSGELNAIPLTIGERIISTAQKRLDPFEDGRPDQPLTSQISRRRARSTYD